MKMVLKAALTIFPCLFAMIATRCYSSSFFQVIKIGLFGKVGMTSCCRGLDSFFPGDMMEKSKTVFRRGCKLGIERLETGPSFD